jgi:hypothetical protein
MRVINSAELALARTRLVLQQLTKILVSETSQFGRRRRA